MHGFLTSQKRWYLSLVIIILVLLAYTLAETGLTWWSDWQLTHHTPPHHSITLTSSEETNGTAINLIPETHLFGQAIPAVGNMPLSNLQFHLTGIVHGNQGSKAYIAIANQPSKIYRIGDQLPYGAKILTITDDTVVLQNEGHLEKITLPRQKLEFKTRNPAESL